MGLGNEDIAGLLQDGLTALGETVRVPWGFLGIQIEDRPSTLPPAAATRAHLHCIALANGRSPMRDVPALLNVALPQLHAPPQMQVIYFSHEAWPVKPLLSAGFTIVERVEYLELTRLPQRKLAPLSNLNGPLNELRAVSTADVEDLARLDAETFDPIWHLGQSRLIELLFSCRIQVADDHGRLAGYAAISQSGSGEAYLARLAVHPDYQGHGLGRLLLLESIYYVQAQGATSVVLNTQTDNQSAQQLYRSVGFRPTGTVLPVLVKQIQRM